MPGRDRPIPWSSGSRVRLLRSGEIDDATGGRAGLLAAVVDELVASDEADRGGRQDLLSSEERARLRELKRENRVLRRSGRS